MLKYYSLHHNLLSFIVPLKTFRENYIQLLLVGATLLFNTGETFAAVEETTVSATNFSFANYLGTGFYTSSGQDVFVIQLPFAYSIKEKTNTEAGIRLKLPLTIGIINFGDIETADLPDINDITTLTFLPGIEYQYPITSNWTISPFADYGVARDFNNSSNIVVTGIGIKSYYNIPVKNALLSLSNRFLYAREKNKDAGNNSDYSLIETGINYRTSSDFTHDNGVVFNNLYYINFYYPNNLVFLERTANPIRVGIEHEIGVTFSNLPDFWLFEKSQIGLGVRFGNGVNVYRLIIGVPF